MLINRAALDGLFVNLRTEFNKAFKAASPEWQRVAMKVPSTSSANDYKWLGNWPRMREWVGDKVLRQLSAFQYTVPNRDFEATIEVRRNDLEDDTYGIYRPQAEGAGQAAATWPDELVFALLNGGFDNLCYDGQPFFDNDHPVGQPGSGAVVSVSNKGTAVLAAGTLAEAQASYGAARTILKKMKDDEGRPLGVMPDLLVVPPALEDTALVIANNERFEDGKPNPYKGTCKVMVSAWLTSDTAWFLLDTTKAVKPLIFQERKAPTFVQQTNPDSDDVFNRAVYKYGAEARGAGGYGLWQLAIGSTGLGS